MNRHNQSARASILFILPVAIAAACNPSTEPANEPGGAQSQSAVDGHPREATARADEPTAASSAEPLEVGAVHETRVGESDRSRGESQLGPAKQASRKSGKVAPPANVALTASALQGTFEATLDIEATADIPRAVAKFKLPRDARLVSGEREKDLGALKASERRTLRVTVSLPDGASGVLAAGVDLYLSSGVKLHAGDALRIGTSP